MTNHVTTNSGNLSAATTGDQGLPMLNTPGPWEYVPSTEHHGPYVTTEYGSTVCDCYTMSNLAHASVRNGGDSKPIHFMSEQADANALLIAAAPVMLAALQIALNDATLNTDVAEIVEAAIELATRDRAAGFGSPVAKSPNTQEVVVP